MGRITDVAGVRVGHHTDTEGITGCTVVLLPEGTVGAYTVVGAAPGTRETQPLDQRNLVGEAHAFVLSGGSAFGLGCADGVVAVLEERGVGFAYGGVHVPIVPTAILFDLGIGDPRCRPGPDEGRAATLAADVEFEEGSVGAGTGATVGKWGGRDHAMKGGLGTASAPAGDATVGAVVACNAAGDVLDSDGGVLAGARVEADAPWHLGPGESTVLAAVATDAKLDKTSATHIARMAAVGISRAVRPAHTFYDGDIVFVGATGPVEVEPNLVGSVAAEVVGVALRRGVRAAKGLGGVPGLADREP